jgi:rhodanese-related sulfurtransferase
MNTPLPIGHFQFDNLVRNRVPFMLLKSLAVDVESMFGPVEKSHLRNFSLPLQTFDLHSAQASLAERQAQKDSPLVILCKDGKSSLELAKLLCEQGFLNVYYVLDGMNGLSDQN